MSHLHDCPSCAGRPHPGPPCPRSIECGQCGAPVGSPCVRPSGHQAFGGDVHAARRVALGLAWRHNAPAPERPGQGQLL